MARLAQHPDAYVTFTPTATTSPNTRPPIEDLDGETRKKISGEAWAFIMAHMKRINGIAKRVCAVVPGDQREEAIEHVKIALVEQWPRLRALIVKANSPERMETTVITMTAYAVARSWDRRRRFGAAHVQGDVSIDAPTFDEGAGSLHDRLASDSIAETITGSMLSNADKALVFELMADCSRDERAAIRAYLAGEESRPVTSALRKIGNRVREEWGACYAA